MILYQGDKLRDCYLCLLVAYSLPIKEVRNNIQKYFIGRNNVHRYIPQRKTT